MTREVNRGVYQLANGIVQLVKMFYDKNKVRSYIGDEGVTFLKFNGDKVQKGTKIIVRDGQPVILDPQARFNQAIQLWQLGAIDPETLFEMLEFPDPQTAAKKTASWRAGQLLLGS